jgi:potassium-transporting ATPase KdpC subunit
MQSFIVSIRLVIVTMAIVVAGYTGVVLGFAKMVAPDSAQGSLIKKSDGSIIGSHLIAQKFTQPGYFWPRPSAVDYNASAAGGSNKSPTSSDLTDRATKTVAEYGATAEKPLPAELAAASGGGLDPHITEHGALYQVERVAKARGLPEPKVKALVEQQAFIPGGFLAPDRLVNVLELNLALDGAMEK